MVHRIQTERCGTDTDVPEQYHGAGPEEHLSQRGDYEGGQARIPDEWR